MPVLYDFIYNQVTHIVRMLMEDADGTIRYTDFIPDERWLGPIITIISAMIFIFIALVFGVFLWNQGLVPAFPRVFAKLSSSSPGQYRQPYVQFLITFFALQLLI